MNEQFPGGHQPARQAAGNGAQSRSIDFVHSALSPDFYFYFVQVDLK